MIKESISSINRMGELGEVEGNDLSLGVGRAYLFVILVVIPFIMILTLIYVGLRGSANYFTGLGKLTTLSNFLPVLILGVPFHEFLHAAGWSIFGRMPIREVKFGVMWKALTPYAHLRKPIRAFVYKAGAVFPALLMGFIPYMIGLLFGHAWLVNFGLLFVLAAGGDLLVIWTLRNVSRDAMVIDHPTRVGCIVLGKENLE